MKILISLFLLFPFLAFGQSPVTNSAGTGETVPSSACMACPGSSWNNELNITNLDGQFSTIGLTQSNFCFQSSCFYSRYLYAHNFGFSIPTTATIDSIFVTISKRAYNSNVIKDSIVQLQKVLSITGSNLASPTFWTTTVNTINYGNSDPLWSTTWTPSDINDPLTGVILQIVNYSPIQEQAAVDQIQMTIYYSTATGSNTVTSSPSSINWINTFDHSSAQIFVSQKTNCASRLFDMKGNLIMDESISNISIGVNEIELNTTQLVSGIYFWQIEIDSKLFSRKIIVN